HVPRTNGYLINRSHLFDKLEKGLDTKLTLITAPAGYGKSTLLSEWTKKVDASIAWVSLDENDNDSMRFWKHTIGALYQASSGFAEQFVPEGQDFTSNAAIANLINRLNDFSEKIVLIWDDFHRVDHVLILDSITYLLEHLPPSIH